MAVSKEVFMVRGVESDDDMREVESKLKGVEGVMGMEFESGSGKAEIRYDEDLTSGERVKDEVREMGYDVE